MSYPARAEGLGKYDEQFLCKSTWSVRSIDRILTGTATSGQSGPGSNGHEGLLQIP